MSALNWHKPFFRYSTLLISLIHLSCFIYAFIGFRNTFCIIIGLDAYWDYIITVNVFTDPFPSKQSTAAVLKTSQSGNSMNDIYILEIFGEICAACFTFRMKIDFFLLIKISNFLITAPGKVESFDVKQDPNITAKTNVQLQWKPPVERDLNGIIQKYFILYSYKQGQTMVRCFF